MSTFGVAMALLKWLPVRVVDGLLLAAAHMILGDTGRLGLRRPKTGPIELKNLTGKTPVLDVGALDQIKSGNITVWLLVRLNFPLALSIYKIYLCMQILCYVSVTLYYLVIVITKHILLLNKKYIKIYFSNYDETNKLKWNILISW